MANLNETIVEVNPENTNKLEQQDAQMDSEDIVYNKVPPYDICGKSF